MSRHTQSLRSFNRSTVNKACLGGEPSCCYIMYVERLMESFFPLSLDDSFVLSILHSLLDPRSPLSSFLSLSSSLSLRKMSTKGFFLCSSLFFLRNDSNDDDEQRRMTTTMMMMTMEGEYCKSVRMKPKAESNAMISWIRCERRYPMPAHVYTRRMITISEGGNR